MYRQILVDPRDFDLQRALWTDSASGSEQQYQLRTVTYGFSCAPYLALRVLRQLGADVGDKYPRAAQNLRRSVYVDDILTGSDDVASAKQLQNELTNLLKAGGFPLRKWVSNYPEIVCDLEEKDRLRPQWKDFSRDQPVKTLGVAWDRSSDEFCYRLRTLRSHPDEEVHAVHHHQDLPSTRLDQPNRYTG